MHSIGYNPIPVKLQKRTGRDFDSPHKLVIAEPPLSITKFELYKRKSVAVTKRRFESDPFCKSVVKLEAQLARASTDKLLSFNEEMKKFLEWRQGWEDKKMYQVKQTKLILAKEVLLE